MRACSHPEMGSSRSLQEVPAASGMSRVSTTMSGCAFWVLFAERAGWGGVGWGAGGWVGGWVGG